MKIKDLTAEAIETKKKCRGFSFYLPLLVTVTVKPDSYLHIGASGSPLSDKKGPVFTISGRPVIPASSFKGAWRAQLETLLQRDFNGLVQRLPVPKAVPEHWKPCIPAPERSVTKAEKEDLKKTHKLSSCQVEVAEETIRVNGREPRKEDPAVCPVCYFFGANGLAGFVRVSNLMLDPQQTESGLFDQTRIRRLRGAHDGVAPGALVTLDQVEPNTKFLGEMEIILEDGRLTFGKPRTLGEGRGDLWLEGLATDQLRTLQSAILRELLLPALVNIQILGGMRSMKAGNVAVAFDLA